MFSNEWNHVHCTYAFGLYDWDTFFIPSDLTVWLEKTIRSREKEGGGTSYTSQSIVSVVNPSWADRRAQKWILSQAIHQQFDRYSDQWVHLICYLWCDKLTLLYFHVTRCNQLHTYFITWADHAQIIHTYVSPEQIKTFSSCNPFLEYLCKYNVSVLCVGVSKHM